MLPSGEHTLSTVQRSFLPFPSDVIGWFRVRPTVLGCCVNAFMTAMLCVPTIECRGRTSYWILRIIERESVASKPSEI